MSFWKKAGELALKAGSAAFNEAKAAADRSHQYKEEMPSKGDSELLQIVKQDRERSPLRAGAAWGELKNRGYSPEEIKERIL